MRTVFWENDKLCLIDQTLIPEEYKVLRLDKVEEVAEAIIKLRVRGAPAIGVAAAFGVVLGAIQAASKDVSFVLAELKKVGEVLVRTRPTATNLAWAVEQMLSYAETMQDIPYAEFINKLVAKAKQMADDEVAIAQRISKYGAEVIPKEGAKIITHCNTGPLCTIDVGLCMGAVHEAVKQGKKVHVFTDETRPRLQGAKLNTFDLKNLGVPFTLITDNTAAYVMKKGMVDLAFIGADRVAANGDTAAKIGVYGLAVLAREHGIPLFCFSPMATIDYSIQSGEEIIIEERDPEEVLKINGVSIAPANTPVLNYAFDVTPAKYFSGIITEYGIAYPPFKKSLQELKEKYESR